MTNQPNNLQEVMQDILTTAGIEVRPERVRLKRQNSGIYLVSAEDSLVHSTAWL